MKRYVGAFLFSEPHDRVILIKRHEPHHFAHKLNCVIGQIDKDEDIHTAVREMFKGETGVDCDSWSEAVRLKTPTSIIHFFRAFSTKLLWAVVDKGSTDLVILHPDRLNEFDVVGNMRWIIPICMDETIRTPIKVDDPVAEESKGHPNQGS